MRMAMAILAVFASGTSTAPAKPPTCKAEHAVYRLRGAPGFVAGFARQRHQVNFASDLYFYLQAPKRRFWFSFNAPNGYGGVFIAPDKDPRKLTAAERENPPPAPKEQPPEWDFDSFDARYTHLDNPPQSGDPAPAHLFARGIGPALWYNPTMVANGDKRAKAESIPIAMYDLVGCRTPKRQSESARPLPATQHLR